VKDDRYEILEGDRTLLIIEDDVAFARILYDVARDHDFKALVALRGDIGLALAHEFKPDAITLDIQMPDVDGWLVLDQLKHSSQTRHIPVHVISVVDDQKQGLELGVFANLQKPVTKDALNDVLARVREFIDRPTRTLLLVEDAPHRRDQIIETVQEEDVTIVVVDSGEAALASVRQQPFDVIVLDLDLPDMSGFELIERICSVQETRRSPIILFAPKNLTTREEARLKRIAKSVAVKNVTTMEHLLDETVLFLHRIETNLPPEKQRILEHLHTSSNQLAGKKVLIVDDDIRNIFALTSVLEGHQMIVLYAENGQAGIDMLNSNTDIDAVLMDIMMPGMDGYETIRSIRRIPQFALLPIIAVTAKAMKGDREKCISAGASNYITKPVETDYLLSMLRVLLGKERM
jgi:CheY-like chemotaxis protein